jgi:acrosin
MRCILSRIFGSQQATNRRGRPTKKARRHIAIEALEDRWVPSTLQVVNGALTYTAGAGVANNLRVTAADAGGDGDGTNYVFTDASETILAPGFQGSGTHTVILTSETVGSMLINLGDKADQLVIESTIDPTTVKAGDGDDKIDVGQFVGGALRRVEAAVTVDGGAGSDTLRVNDPASAASRAYAVTATRVTPAGGSDRNYAGVERLAVTAGALADAFNVFATAAGTITTLNAGAGSDTFNVGSAANTLDDIKSRLTLEGGDTTPFSVFFRDQVNLLDQGSAAAHSYVVRENVLIRSGSAGSAEIAYVNAEGVALNAGAAADTALVLTTSASAPVTLNMGGGHDVLNVGTRTGSSLDGVASPVTVNGEAGTDTVNLNDQADANANSYVVITVDVKRNGVKVLNYATVESLTLNAGAFDDAVLVPSTLAATPVTLKTGGGNDVVNVGSASDSLDGILGRVSIDGQLGADRLSLNDQGRARGLLYEVNAAAVLREAMAPVSYAGVEDLTLNAASVLSVFTPVNSIAVKGTSTATTINGSAGLRDAFTVGNGGNSLDDIRGPLTINGRDGDDSLVLEDRGDANANSYTVSAASVTRAGSALISYSLPGSVSFFAGLTINAGAFDDAAIVRSAAAGAPVTLNMGAGQDRVTLGGNLITRLGGIASPVTVRGEAGVDSVVVSDVDNGLTPAFGFDFKVTSTDVTRGGRQVLRYETAEGLTLTAGSGNDTVRVASSAAATPVVVLAGLGNDTLRPEGLNAAVFAGRVTLDGQGGTDTLDYSGFGTFSTVAFVSLATGQATGAAGGVSNVENVIGTAGNDILIGNDQANVLRGGFGRDLLIGRGGADALFGEGGDDILIGGSAAFDEDADALGAIMAEWTRTDLTGTAVSQYLLRVRHLLGAVTGVRDDGVGDTLTAGAGVDWFFQLGADVLADLGPSERVN